MVREDLKENYVVIGLRNGNGCPDGTPGREVQETCLLLHLPPTHHVPLTGHTSRRTEESTIRRNTMTCVGSTSRKTGHWTVRDRSKSR